MVRFERLTLGVILYITIIYYYTYIIYYYYIIIYYILYIISYTILFILSHLSSVLSSSVLPSLPFLPLLSFISPSSSSSRFVGEYTLFLLFSSQSSILLLFPILYTLLPPISQALPSRTIHPPLLFSSSIPLSIQSSFQHSFYTCRYLHILIYILS